MGLLLDLLHLLLACFRFFALLQDPVGFFGLELVFARLSLGFLLFLGPAYLLANQVFLFVLFPNHLQGLLVVTGLLAVLIGL